MRKNMILIVVVLVVCLFTGCANASTAATPTTAEPTIDVFEYTPRKYTVSEQEEMAEAAVCEKIVEWMEKAKSFAKYDVSATKYKIGSVEWEDDRLRLYITVYLYDKYGDFEKSCSFAPLVEFDENGRVKNVMSYTFLPDDY